MLAFVFLIVIPALALADVPMSVFESIDKDNDQKIKQEELKDYILAFDTNKNTEVDKQEFDDGLEKQDPHLAAYKDTLFSMLDRNKDGKIVNSDIGAIFAIADTDDDGNLSKAEFNAAAQDVNNTIVG